MGMKNPQKVASAFAPDNIKLAYQLIQDLESISVLPFDLNLLKLSLKKDRLVNSDDLSDLNETWLDYQPNSLAWPLASEKLKIIIEKSLTGNEGIDWIVAHVFGNGERREYYIPRFKKLLDVLDIDKTMFIPGTNRIIKPCFSLSKISKYSVFHKPSENNLWEITLGLYVSDTLKKAIQKEKLTGIVFDKIFIT
jgi:hypothetical protein